MEIKEENIYGAIGEFALQLDGYCAAATVPYDDDDMQKIMPVLADMVSGGRSASKGAVWSVSGQPRHAKKNSEENHHLPDNETGRSFCCRFYKPLLIMFVTHAFQPVYDSSSKILILGTMPSPQSVKHGFYYSHPQNRFWPLMSTLFHEPRPMTPAEKTAFVLRHHIALWDVLASCEINGASDASIRRPVPNDFTQILQNTRIERICTTGKAAYTLFQKHVAPVIGRDAIYLPSTSPANQALFPWDKLLAEWKKMLD